MFQPVLDGLVVASALDDGGIVFVGDQPPGCPQQGDLGVLDLQAPVGADHGASGDDGDIFQQCLSALSEARSLDGHAINGAPQLIDHQGGQGLSIHILGDDHQGPFVCLEQLLHDAHNIVGGADLLVSDQEHGLVDGHFHALGVADEMGGEITTVDADAFHELQFVGEGLGLFDGHHAVPAHLVQGIGQQFGYGFFVGGEGGDPGDLLPALHGGGHGL